VKSLPSVSSDLRVTDEKGGRPYERIRRWNRQKCGSRAVCWSRCMPISCENMSLSVRRSSGIGFQLRQPERKVTLT